MPQTTTDIAIFLIVVSAIITAMIAFIITMLFFYRKRQIVFIKDTERLKDDYHKNILSTKLEIQEKTFQKISQEIHDNISLSLTLAKLHLYTIDFSDKTRSKSQVNLAIELLHQSIGDLSDISKSLNADIIIQHGLLKALENEITQIKQTGLFNLNLKVSGTPIYMEGQKELIIFRLIQEAFNNILKHSKATNAQVAMHYSPRLLHITISDNGVGFDIKKKQNNFQAGLKNMETRITMLNGTHKIHSAPGQGTVLFFKIPTDIL